MRQINMLQLVIVMRGAKYKPQEEKAIHYP